MAGEGNGDCDDRGKSRGTVETRGKEQSRDAHQGEAIKKERIAKKPP